MDDPGLALSEESQLSHMSETPHGGTCTRMYTRTFDTKSPHKEVRNVRKEAQKAKGGALWGPTSADFADTHAEVFELKSDFI